MHVMDCNADSQRCCQLRKTKYLFNRELCGDQNGVRRPTPVTRHCERVSILKLDNGDLRKHIVSSPAFNAKVVTNYILSLDYRGKTNLPLSCGFYKKTSHVD